MMQAELEAGSWKVIAEAREAVLLVFIDPMEQHMSL